MSASQNEGQRSDATLSLGGRTASLPVLSGTLGPDVVDIRKLPADMGVFTYDPGYGETASCSSKITFIDGDKGVLLHRGYPIAQLAEHASYEEVIYLLLNGELPNKADYEKFSNTLTNHTLLHEQIRNFFNGFRRDAHPMAILCGTVGALSAFYPDASDIAIKSNRELAAMRLIAKIPTIAAWAYKYTQGEAFIYPRNDLNYAENLLSMMFARVSEPYKINPVLARAMNRILILHADHEQNASTSTVRMAGSTGANPFACISAGIAALWGPAHGGANEAVLKMLASIGSKENIPDFIAKVKDKSSGVKLMASAIAFIKTSTPAPKSCSRPAMKCWANSALKMIRCWIWPLSLRKSRSTMSISCSGNSTRTSISIQASS